MFHAHDPHHPSEPGTPSGEPRSAADILLDRVRSVEQFYPNDPRAQEQFARRTAHAIRLAEPVERQLHRIWEFLDHMAAARIPIFGPTDMPRADQEEVVANWALAHADADGNPDFAADMDIQLSIIGIHPTASTSTRRPPTTSNSHRPAYHTPEAHSVARKRLSSLKFPL